MVLACFVFVSWNTLYSLKIVLMEKSSYGTPCIQSLGCLLLQCVCKYQILGPPEVERHKSTAPRNKSFNCWCQLLRRCQLAYITMASGDQCLPTLATFGTLQLTSSCSLQPMKTKGELVGDGKWISLRSRKL